jgi:hypothetical protein
MLRHLHINIAIFGRLSGYAVVAQWLERWARNQKVPGSRSANVVIWGLVHSTITEYLAGRYGFVTDWSFTLITAAWDVCSPGS